MDAELKKTLKAVTLELRHLLEGRYDSAGKWKPGDLEQDERVHPHFLGTGEWVAPSNPWYRRVGGPIQSPFCHF
jgi:hypothetical protein